MGIETDHHRMIKKAQGRQPMSAKSEHIRNQAAYRHLKDRIKATYPHGQFIAISGGQIVADAADFEQLRSMLLKQGKDPGETLIVRAGEDYPESAIILSSLELE
jgi:hypothetical protein